jgi:alginate lyase
VPSSRGAWGALLAAAACVAGSAVEGSPAPTLSPRPGVWISKEEVALLPMAGRAWEALKSAADEPLGPVRLKEKDDRADVLVMARALVFARCGGDRYRQEVADACRAAMGSERGGDCLALGRNLPGYVIAADLVGLPPDLEGEFRAWLRRMLDEPLEGRTLRATHEDRPNNWGTHAGGSRAVVARYLGDSGEIARVAQVFKGWLGDRRTYAGFRFRESWWQADSSAPVGVNPRGAVREGHSIDGVLPDDQRRAGPFQWPPPKENYVYEALQGALLQAVVLSRAGYDVWEWEDRALLRAFRWLQEEAAYPAEGDDTWQPHLVNRAYGCKLPAPVPSRPGKNVGFTDWTHAPSP